jgi:hypothetical protein
VNNRRLSAFLHLSTIYFLWRMFIYYKYGEQNIWWKQHITASH